MKKMKLKKIALVILSIALLLSGCVRETESGEPKKVEEPEPMNETPTYSYQIPLDESDLLTGKSADYLRLVNKEHPLGSGDVPKNLVSFSGKTSGGKTVELDAKAAKALALMLSEMELSGIRDVSVTSGYRSYSYQSSCYQRYVTDESERISGDAIAYFGMDYLNATYLSKGLTRLSREDAIKVVDTYSARPGYSEHQTGLCADLILDGMGGNLDNAFEESSAFRWLSENAYRFGFILRYPSDKTEITGYSYESWHYRFVGREAATEIYEAGITLEEYLQK